MVNSKKARHKLCGELAIVDSDEKGYQSRLWKLLSLLSFRLDDLFTAENCTNLPVSTVAVRLHAGLLHFTATKDSASARYMLAAMGAQLNSDIVPIA